MTPLAYQGRELKKGAGPRHRFLIQIVAGFSYRLTRYTIEKTAHKRPEPQTFPLSGAAVDVLKGWWKQQGEPKVDLVFPSPVTGKRMAPTAMQKPWAAVRKSGGLPNDLQLYTLRHNFASQLVMAGADLLAVSKLMAHADIQTTIAHYAHLAPDHKRDIVEAFARRAPRLSTETIVAAEAQDVSNREFLEDVHVAKS
ncbi:tyrosine-type recombinase/integrase [Halomonas lysinitropha]|uniref:Tyrosine recombinase XerC n=1 Tax=Halomonas lysinitropha TaxID=2607506 RepID=A0A5K1HZL5_9GAMM|nr:tyrosine-type recombinase/integrase [Halomonas lysinitropha]VVZ94645.1 Tyrosine recombinase XerC [Halomonas lysinitropha]